MRFVRLDPDGYDHVVVGKQRHAIPADWLLYRDRMVAAFPEAATPLRHYFRIIPSLVAELDALPDHISLTDILTAPLHFPTLLEMRTWTLQRLYDHLKMPPLPRAILAGQCGDYLLPPSQVSLLLHANLVIRYGRGAYYPEKHYVHFIQSLVDFIASQPGCAVLLNHDVTALEQDRGLTRAVTTAHGVRVTGKRFFANMDPRHVARLLGANVPSSLKDRLNFQDSYGTVTLYLGLKDLDLRAHGFGSFNVWSYPHEDLDGIYAAQGERNDLSNPWLFLSTPTLHTAAPGLAPPGHHILEVATHARHQDWRALRDKDRTAYNREKKKLREHLLEVLEQRFIPGLPDHVDLFVLGTPATNERFVRAPHGNAYGAALTPDQVGLRRKPLQVMDNLWVINATLGWPSIGGTVGAGRALVAQW